MPATPKPNLVMLVSTGLSTGIAAVTPNQIARWRRPRPQPFNVQSVEDAVPTEGQVWPIGVQQG